MNDEIYIKETIDKYGNIQLKWDMAIGLQKVDNLSPSNHLLELSEQNIKGQKTLAEVKNELLEYYQNKDINKKDTREKYECDLVSVRIIELLDEDSFELSVEYMKYIHKFLFQDIYEFAGQFRDVDIIKKENILCGDTVIYVRNNNIERSFKYDISLEKEKSYDGKNMFNVINNIVDFTSRIWQVHPFREGNTRTITVFIEKYLTSLGYKSDNNIFKENSAYFRNALVRNNYYNDNLSIPSDKTYLVKFFENLLLDKNNKLNITDLIINELFDYEIKSPKKIR